jgi:hypothetical protein
MDISAPVEIRINRAPDAPGADTGAAVAIGVTVLGIGSGSIELTPGSLVAEGSLIAVLMLELSGVAAGASYSPETLPAGALPVY